MIQIPDQWRTFPSQFHNAKILEIGALDKPFPVYNNCDVTYADRYTWEEQSARFAKDPQVNCEKIVKAKFLVGEDRYTIYGANKDEYDLVMSSHVLEHVPNAPMAILHWLDLAKVGGHVFYVIPDKRAGFIDGNRPRTPINYFADKAIKKDNDTPIHVYVEYFWDTEKNDDPAVVGRNHADQHDIHSWVWTHETHLDHLKWLKIFSQDRFEIVETKRPDPLNICVLLKRLA